MFGPANVSRPAEVCAVVARCVCPGELEKRRGDTVALRPSTSSFCGLWVEFPVKHADLSPYDIHIHIELLVSKNGEYIAHHKSTNEANGGPRESAAAGHARGLCFPRHLLLQME